MSYDNLPGSGGGGNYGSVPPSAGGGYGQVPPAQPGGGYGQVPPAQPGAGYGQVPPASAAGGYGQVPSPAPAAYGQAPGPAGHSQYGNAPPAASNNPYGSAPPPAANGHAGPLTDYLDQSYWKPNWTRPAAERMLMDADEMVAVLRPSRDGKLSVSYKKDGKPLHTQVEKRGTMYVVIDMAGDAQKFTTMQGVFEYLQVRPYTPQAVPTTHGAGGPVGSAQIPGVDFDYDNWNPKGDQPPPHPGELEPNATPQEYQTWKRKQQYYELWESHQAEKRRQAAIREQHNLNLINGVGGPSAASFGAGIGGSGGEVETAGDVGGGGGGGLFGKMRNKSSSNVNRK